jgi:uncharacterized protein
MPLIPEATNPLPAGRVREVEELLVALRSWAHGRPDVRAVALVGSWVRGTARADSDLDIVLLTDSPASYIEREDWVAGFGADSVVRMQRWGALTERRLSRPSGLEVEVGVVSPAWASVDPLDDGTAQVAGDGLVALYDPDKLLARLVDAVAEHRAQTD